MNLSAIKEFKKRPEADEIRLALNTEADLQLMQEARLAGVFELLDREYRSAEEIGITEKLINKRLAVLLDALCAAGFCEKSENKYRLSEKSAVFLKSESRFYYGDNLNRRVSDDIIKNSEGLSNWLHGISEKKLHEPEKIFDASFLKAMAQKVVLDGSVYETAELLSKLPWFTGIKTLLDLGGGHGLFAIALKKLLPQLSAQVFDLPQNEGTEKEYAALWGENVEFVSGNFYSDPLPKNYDMILCCDIMYPVSTEKKTLVFTKVYEALNIGGHLCWKLMYLNEDRISPCGAAGFMLNLCRGNDEVQFLSISQACGMLEGIGFVIEDILTVEDDYSWKIISAVKK